MTPRILTSSSALRHRLSLFAKVLGVTLALAFAAPAAQAFPDKPLKIVVPFVPGGATDQLGRLLAEKLSVDLGQQVIVENKPGGNTIIAADQVARAPADGYTLFVAAGSTLVLNPLLYKKLPYDPAKDFKMLALLGEVPLIAVVPVSLKVNNLEDLIAYAKQQNGKVNYASVGTGSTLHLAGELFKQAAGIQMTHVPYKGSAQALTDVMGGQVELIFDAYPTAYPLIESGKLRALGVSSKNRLATLPQVPAIAESVPDYLAIVWYGLVVAKNTPEPIAAKLKTAIDKVLVDPAFKASMAKMGFEPGAPMNPQQIQQYIDGENQRWSTVIKAQNIQLEN